jgi:hypothetical protein
MAVGVNIVSEFNAAGIKKAIKDFKTLQSAGDRTDYAMKTLDKSLSNGIKNLAKFGASAVVPMAKFAAAAAGASAVVGYKLVDAASNLQESQSKVNAVFGESALRITEFAKTTSRSLGITRQAALEAAGTFGNLIQAFGIARPQAAAMSEEMVRLAADLASFNNVPIDEVFQALRSGLTGETEPMKRFGVAINDVRLKQEAMNMGLYDGKGALDITAKTQAAYALILKDTALAQGDVERTSQGFANQVRFLKAQLADAAAELGLVLLPYAERFVKFLNNNVVPAVRLFAEQVGQKGLGDAFAYALASMGHFGDATIDTMESVSVSVLTVLKDVLSVTERVSQAVVLAAAARGNVALAIRATAIGMGAGKAEEMLGDRLKTLGGDFDKLREKVALAGEEIAKFRRVEGLKATFDELHSDRLIGKTTKDLNDFAGGNGTGGIGGASKAIDTAKEKFQKYVDALKGVTKAQQAARDASKALKQAQTQLTDANTKAAAAQEYFRLVTTGYGADSKQAKTQQQALAQAQRKVERSGYGVEQAIFAVARAEQELADLRLDPEASATAIREAEIALAEAKLTVADATDNQRDATQELADAETRLEEIINGAKEGSEAYKEASDALTAAKLDQANAVDAVTAALEREKEAIDAVREAEKKRKEERENVTSGQAARAEAEVNGTGGGGSGMFPSFIEAVKNLHPNSKALNSPTPVRAAKAQFPKLYETYKAAGLALAKGGIVTSPTTALIGEAGPEAVVPLDNLQSGMNITININAGMGTDAAALGDEIVNVLQRYNRRNGALPLKVAS